MPMTELFTIGRDAVVRQAGQTSVCNLSLAYPYGQKDQQTGRKPTQWVDAALWGKRAEAMAAYLTKGTKVCATLEDVHVEPYTDRDGNPATKLVGNIIAITLAGSPQAAAPQAPPPPPPRPAQRPAAAPPTRTGFDDMDDDIPF